MQGKTNGTRIKIHLKALSVDASSTAPHSSGSRINTPHNLLERPIVLVSLPRLRNNNLQCRPGTLSNMHIILIPLKSRGCAETV